MTALKFTVFPEQKHNEFARLSAHTQDAALPEKVTVFWTLTVT